MSPRGSAEEHTEIFGVSSIGAAVQPDSEMERFGIETEHLILKNLEVSR